MEHVPMGEMSIFQTFQLLILSDILGVVIGIISIALLLKASSTLGGRIQTALSFLIGGLVAMTMSFTATIAIVLSNSMTPTTMALHHIIMVLGMVLFVMAGKEFISFRKIS